MTSVWGVSAVTILYSSVNCVCVWSTKKLTMPAYCVAANCNNSQTTPGITMHELPRNRPAVRRKWIKFTQFKRADFLAAPHHAHLCSEHFSECNFANPMEYRMGFCFEADTMFRYSSKILPDRLKLIRLYLCGSLGQSVSFVFGARVGHFAATPQSDVVGIWSRDLGVMATLSVRQKMPFFRAFITLISQFHLHHRSQRALTEIVSKITPNLGLVLQWFQIWHFYPSDAAVSMAAKGLSLQVEGLFTAPAPFNVQSLQFINFMHTFPAPHVKGQVKMCALCVKATSRASERKN